MAQNPLGGFLKGLFGRPNPAPSNQDPGPPLTPGSPTISKGPGKQARGPHSLPTSDAYLNRKKGRKLHSDSYADAKKLFEAIQRRGEATPGDLAQESAMARSTLAYHLNRLIRRGYIVRTGGGRSIRYKVTGKPFGRIDMDTWW